MDDDVSAHLRRKGLATCAECGLLSGPNWHGWRAYRTDDPEHQEPPELTFYCPDCAQREFGAS